VEASSVSARRTPSRAISPTSNASASSGCMPVALPTSSCSGAGPLDRSGRADVLDRLGGRTRTAAADLDRHRGTLGCRGDERRRQQARLRRPVRRGDCTGPALGLDRHVHRRRNRPRRRRRPRAVRRPAPAPRSSPAA
jgi:hypothetical protein